MSHFLSWQVRTSRLLRANDLVSSRAYPTIHYCETSSLQYGPAAPSVSRRQNFWRRRERLVDWLCRERVSVVHLTPGISQLIGDVALSDAAGGESESVLPALRLVFFGGDVLTRRHVAAMRRLAPTARCVNFYGATETPQAMGYSVLDDSIPEETGCPSEGELTTYNSSS